MAKPEWGSKRLCQSCGLKFYDLGKLPAVCPDCDTEYKEVVAKRPAPPAAPKEAKKPAPKHDRRKRASTGEDGESEELEDEIEDDDVDDDVDDEVDLDDDDDLKEVIEASSGS